MVIRVAVHCKRWLNWSYLCQSQVSKKKYALSAGYYYVTSSIISMRTACYIWYTVRIWPECLLCCCCKDSAKPCRLTDWQEVVVWLAVFYLERLIV